jgi:hypothetical protein
MHEAQLQDYLFQRIKEKLSATASLADAVAETLFISNDSAYRRIRGETPLVLEEARTLCARFSISFDEVLHSKSNTVSFLYSKINNQDYSFEKYLQGYFKQSENGCRFGKKGDHLPHQRHPRFL